MYSVLIGIATAFLLGISSLVVVIFRVSPLTSSEFALPFFFLSLIISISSFFALSISLVQVFINKHLLHKGHSGKFRRIISSSMRQGAFISIATCFVILLHLLHILNWWIAVLIYLVFALIEIAISR
ncbi:hypothetical protein HOF56_00495 [Candidatus Peribacteria bacterium]|jgi:hypothetical protein|nr:hypothetical protein [Candidatus Peribacteria bacterium]MBT4020890.1 hypothetical protein [Candidatus Peribacteria bacterium]MBT4240976.1 hypothetical protein [Candidatus Peribacteria bacterium]MBT4473889.1 hypothetical protein [Candidatus Peribacteria bacterium]